VRLARPLEGDEILTVAVYGNNGRSLLGVKATSATPQDDDTYTMVVPIATNATEIKAMWWRSRATAVPLCETAMITHIGNAAGNVNGWTEVVKP